MVDSYGMESPTAGNPAIAAHRVDHWQLRSRRLVFGPLPSLMGIINVTPDSFSDGGRYREPQAAIDHGLELAEQGAQLLDVGGESTRPGSEPIAAEEELARVLPVLTRLCRVSPVPVAIDTTKAVVAQAALDAGVEIVNDVTAARGDPAMTEVISRAGCGFCLMHMQGTPATMQIAPDYDDVVAQVAGFLAKRREAMVGAGVPGERIALDPGIGFGKALAHNLALLSAMGRFHILGSPLLVGPSRKGYIGTVLGDRTLDRTAGTIGTALALALQQVQVLRVHDVGAVHQALTLFAASGGLTSRQDSDRCPPTAAQPRS